MSLRLQKIAADFTKRRLSPDGFLGLHLTIGGAIVLFSTFLFVEIGLRLGAAQPLARADQQVVEWLHQGATPALTDAALAISFFGSVRFLVVATFVLLAVFARRGMWNRLLVFGLGMLGESVINLLLKHGFHRHRPILENPLVTLSSYGFPSGHTMGATVFYGLCALILAQFVRRTSGRILIFAAASVIIVFIGSSRIYLGAHFPSDVVGALLAGIAWLAVCWTGLETIRRRKRRPPSYRRA